MTIGGVLNDSFDLYQRFFWRFVATAAVVYVVLDLIGALVASIDRGNALAVLFWIAVAVVVGVIGIFWLTGALVEAVRDVRDGRIDTTIGELYRRTQPRVPALIAAGLLAGLAIGLLAITIVGIPIALFLLTRWSLIPAVIILEGRSAGESFGRSWELVRGASWRVLAIVLVIGVATKLLSGIVQAVIAAILPDFLGAWLGGLAGDSLVAPLLALAITLVYYARAGETAGQDAVPAAARP